MSSSSVPVECMFSTTGLISNGKRSSIAPEKLNRVLFGHDNFSLITNDSCYSLLCYRTIFLAYSLQTERTGTVLLNY